MSIRLTLAVDDASVVVPEDGILGVFHPTAGADLSMLDRTRCQVIQPNYPDHMAFQNAGYACTLKPEGRFALSIVFLPRAKAAARLLIAQAMNETDGLVLIDGAKTDGVESVLKDLRRRTPVHGVISKAHGKLFWLDADVSVVPDWLEHDTRAGAFVTAPGVFSADAVDPASALLAEALPETLGARVADLGAGWGYLASRILEKPGLKRLYLVEADHIALDCARLNVSDPRASFHWADATDWSAPEKLDAVVTNPPFHAGRTADPALGRRFIAAAAGNLAPSGRLWMVANRHLPYEAELATHFAQTEEIAGTGRFKLICASRPLGTRRKAR